MRSVTWPTRLVALLQLLLLLPPLAGGSVCISLDGTGRLEPGPCACMVVLRCTSEATIGATGTEACGPCRDEVFSAWRSTVPPPPSAMMTALAFVPARVCAVAAPVIESPAFWAGDPPGTHLPILRC